MLLTSVFLGESLTTVGVVPILGVNFLSMLGEAIGSFLGEIFIFLGEAVVLLLCSSSLFFIMASLELVLTGAGLFRGDGLIMSSVTLLLRLVLAGLLVLPAAESELLFLRNVDGAGLSSLSLRALKNKQAKNKNTDKVKHLSRYFVFLFHHLLCLRFLIKHG